MRNQLTYDGGPYLLLGHKTCLNFDDGKVRGSRVHVEDSLAGLVRVL